MRSKNTPLITFRLTMSLLSMVSDILFRILGTYPLIAVGRLFELRVGTSVRELRITFLVESEGRVSLGSVIATSDGKNDPAARGSMWLQRL